MGNPEMDCVPMLSVEENVVIGLSALTLSQPFGIRVVSFPAPVKGTAVPGLTATEPVVPFLRYHVTVVVDARADTRNPVFMVSNSVAIGMRGLMLEFDSFTQAQIGPVLLTKYSPVDGQENDPVSYGRTTVGPDSSVLWLPANKLTVTSVPIDTTFNVAAEET